MYSERDFVHEIFSGSFLGSPQEPVWKWADRKIFFDQKQTAELDRYVSAETPWTREIQDAIRDPEVKEVACMKSSQSGFTQAALNAVAYMPDHCPGGVLYAINSKEKGSDVANVRLGPLLKRVAGAQISEDPNDFATLTMRLKNMVVKVSGSGSTSPTRETWYRTVIIDEAEDFEKLKGESSFYRLIKSRFATVPDATLYVIGKPQMEARKSAPDEAIVHEAFLRGSQEHWRMPCPRCGELIVFQRRFFNYSKFQAATGKWDLEALENELTYLCQICTGEIQEYEKYAMVAAGRWVPAEENERMKLGGDPVEPEPGVRSFHINDYVSSWPEITWGKLGVKWVTCAFINPNAAAQVEFRKNHEGLPEKSKEIAIESDVINALRGGITEQFTVEIPQTDGSLKEEARIETLGAKFSLCYNTEGKMIARLPCRPVLISIAVDKQDQTYKWGVNAWAADGQSWTIDYGECSLKKTLFDLRKRPYFVEGSEKPLHIWGGVVDRGHRPKDVYKLCLEARALGFMLTPVLGWGQSNENYTSDSLSKGRDTLKNGVVVEYIKFHDHSVKVDFYHGTIQERSSPRWWLPDPVPPDIIAELTAERWDVDRQRFVHDRHTDGPNDFGDVFKMQFGVVKPAFLPLFAPGAE